jgi:hypothetical protein
MRVERARVRHRRGQARVPAAGSASIQIAFAALPIANTTSTHHQGSLRSAMVRPPSFVCRAVAGRPSLAVAGRAAASRMTTPRRAMPSAIASGASAANDRSGDRSRVRRGRRARRARRPRLARALLGGCARRPRRRQRHPDEEPAPRRAPARADGISRASAASSASRRWRRRAACAARGARARASRAASRAPPGRPRSDRSPSRHAA